MEKHFNYFCFWKLKKNLFIWNHRNLNPKKQNSNGQIYITNIEKQFWTYRSESSLTMDFCLHIFNHIFRLKPNWSRWEEKNFFFIFINFFGMYTNYPLRADKVVWTLQQIIHLFHIPTILIYKLSLWINTDRAPHQFRFTL